MNHPEVIALVSCVKSKKAGRHRAKDLYKSALFKYMRKYAECHADRWFILSAKYGLVVPETILEAYEQTLNGASVADRRKWADEVYAQMRRVGLLHEGVSFL